MEDLAKKRWLEELRDEFHKTYREWRKIAESFGVRFDEVEHAWLLYCRARDAFMKHRDKDLYY